MLCADHHLGYSMPIGGVIALKNHVMPAGVGYDIACGNCAAQTHIKADDLDTGRVMDEISTVLSFGIGQKNNEQVDHPVIDCIAHAHVQGQVDLVNLARSQLGTIGSGNRRCCMVRPRNRSGVAGADDHAVTAEDCAVPSANIVFSTVHPTIASRCCASNPFARRLPPRIRLYRRNVPSTRACCR